jgi:hypothetical protein
MPKSNVIGDLYHRCPSMITDPQLLEQARNQELDL